MNICICVSWTARKIRNSSLLIVFKPSLEPDIAQANVKWRFVPVHIHLLYDPIRALRAKFDIKIEHYFRKDQSGLHISQAMMKQAKRQLNVVV